MRLLEQIKHPQELQAAAVSAGGRQVVVAVGSTKWLSAKSPAAKRRQALHWYDVDDQRLRQRKVVPLEEAAIEKKGQVKHSHVQIAFLNQQKVAVARLVTDSNRQERVQVLVVDLKTGGSRSRLLEDPFPNFVTGVAAASPGQFFVGNQQDVICLDAATLEEVCRTGEFDADGIPRHEDVFGEESMAPGGFAYDRATQRLYTAPGYYNAGVIYCYKFDASKGKLRRQWRREVVEDRPSRNDVELLSIRAVTPNPDGRGATATFLLEDIRFDFWGQPISDAEAARDKALEKKKSRQRVARPKRARLGWLGRFSPSTDEWIEIVSDLARDFEAVGEHHFYGEGKPVQIGYCTCSNDCWETQSIYLDPQRVLIVTPSGLVQVIDMASGQATVDFDLRSSIAKLGENDGPQITCLAFAAGAHRLLVGISNGTLLSLQVEPAAAPRKAVVPKPAGKTKVKLPKPKRAPKPPVMTQSVGHSINPAGFHNSVAITPNGALAACGGRVWDVARQWNVAVLPSYCDHTVLTRDGRRLFSGDANGAVSLWDVASAREIWRGATKYWLGVRHVAISPDERLGASAYGDYKIRLWDLERGKQVGLLEGHKAYVEAVAFSPDGTRLVSASWDKTLRVWDVAGQKPLFTLRGHTREAMGVAWTPDGRWIVSCSGDKTLRIWDVDKRKCVRVLKGHTKEVLCMALAPDGKTAVSGSEERTLRVWSIERGSLVRTIKDLDGAPVSLALAANGLALGKLEHMGTNQGVYHWNVATGESLGRVGQWRVGNNHLAGNGRFVYQMTNGDVYLGTVETARQGRIESSLVDHAFGVWDAERRQRIATYAFTSSGIYEFKEQWGGLSEDGRLAVFGGYHGNNAEEPWLWLWNTHGTSPPRMLKGEFDYVGCAAISADGRYVVSGHKDKLCRIWRTDRLSCHATLAGHNRIITRVAISADGRRALSAAEDQTVRAWDTARGTCLCAFTGHKRGISCIALSRDGGLAASGSEDGLICIWDTNRGECLQALPSPPNQGVQVLVFNPAATRLASGHWSCARIWDRAAGLPLVQYEHEGFTPHGLAFREEEGVLLSLQDSVIRRWALPV